MMNKPKPKTKIKWAIRLCLLAFVMLILYSLYSLIFPSNPIRYGDGSRFLSARQNCAREFSAYMKSPQFFADIDRHWEELIPGYAKYENVDIVFAEDHQPLQHTFVHATVHDRDRKLKLYEHWFGNIYDVHGACRGNFSYIPREFIIRLSKYRTNILYKLEAFPPIPEMVVVSQEPLTTISERFAEDDGKA